MHRKIPQQMNFQSLKFSPTFIFTFYKSSLIQAAGIRQIQTDISTFSNKNTHNFLKNLYSYSSYKKPKTKMPTFG